MTTSSSKQVEEALAQVDDLTPEEVARRVESGEVSLIDLREAEELAADGAIPGSVHVPRGLLEFRADPDSPMHLDGLDPERPTILYCSAGGRSALGAKTLRELGYADVAHLGGGFGAWTESGQPVERVDPQP